MTIDDTDEASLSFYAGNVPVDESLLAPLGRMTWAAIRLHHSIRDTLGLHLTDGLSDKPFDDTLGGVIKRLEEHARDAGEPWESEIAQWSATYGRPAQSLRDRITHAVAYTAEDDRQALRTSLHPKHGGHERVTEALLVDASGKLVLASVRLHQVRESCKSQNPLPLGEHNG
ncbi:hypothetical protein [Mycobacteroides salmoniphilum]|uniref:hypothetical protein n=1 Tax=Mycobacteroides salmoniphilum TaxID=404941 RepID=UPI001292BD1D|nr:hypothetical protein [Mycobacteroides salmoniphilum]